MFGMKRELETAFAELATVLPPAPPPSWRDAVAAKHGK
jgi:hypothetical protein